MQQQNEQNQRARLQLADQIQALQQEVAQLRDQLELVSRQQPGARAAARAGSANPPGANAGDPQEQAAYDGAIDLFRKGQYKEASESFAAFTALYPASQLAPSAQFYLGSSRYALKDFKGAIEQLTSMVQKAPDNARAPDALLVIAGSQIELNNRAGAKTTLQRIVRDYPSAPPPARPRAVSNCCSNGGSRVRGHRLSAHPAAGQGSSPCCWRRFSSHCWLTSRRGRPPCPGAKGAR